MRLHRRDPLAPSFDLASLGGTIATAIAVAAVQMLPLAAPAPAGAAPSSPAPSARPAPTASASARPSPGAATPVRVLVPFGLVAGFAVTSPAASASDKYVTVEDVHIINPSRRFAQSYVPEAFHLLAGERTFVPVQRPGWESLDLASGSVLAPGQENVLTITFRVPSDVTEAKFEFVPHWQSDSGGTVDYCCLYF